MPVTWSDEKLILLYCPGRGLNSRPSAHRGFKHGQGVLRANHSATAAVMIMKHLFYCNGAIICYDNIWSEPLMIIEQQLFIIIITS